MKSGRSTLSVLTISLTFMVLCASQANAKTPVKVIYSGESGDAIAEGLNYQLRDAIAKSGIYRTATDTDDPVFQIRMTCLDPLDQHLVSSCSVVFVLGYKSQSQLDYFLTDLIVVTGANKTEEQAKYILVRLDALLEKVSGAK